MLELLLRIEDACLQFDAYTLAVPGLASVVLGLLLWLGGTRYSAIVLGLVGAALGGVGGLFVSQQFGVALGLSVAVGAAVVALLAVFFQHVVIVLMAMMIFAVVCGVGYMSYNVGGQEWQDTLDRVRQEALSQARSAALAGGGGAANAERATAASEGLADGQGEIIEERRTGVERLKGIVGELRLHAGSHRKMLVLWAVLGGVVGLVLAYVLKRVMMALCCSVVGATGIVGGLSAVLLAKGVSVVSDLQGRGRLVVVVLAGMVVFGALTQLFVVGSGKGKKSESSDEQEEDE